MNLYSVFLIGILSFVLNRKNIILMFIPIEIMLLAITFLVVLSPLSFMPLYRSRESIVKEFKQCIC